MKKTFLPRYSQSAFGRYLAIFTFCLAVGLGFGVQSLQAQVTTNSGSGLAATYPNLAAAITDLNLLAVPATSPVIITLTGDETSPAGGFSITGTGTAVNTIIIQGVGSTITAPTTHTVGALNDAIFKIIGGDYITIQNFTMLENAANLVTTAASNNMTEWGVALLYATTTNGAQNNTIQNNTITLNRVYQNTFGIYSNSTHSATSVTTSATATTSAGGNSGLKIYTNTISNVNQGIVVVGPTAVADMNTGIDIGGVVSGTGNTITNFGTTGTFSGYANVSGTVNGILVRNSLGFNISRNNLTSSSGATGVTAGTLNGIQIPAASTTAGATTVTSNIANNTIALTSHVIAGTINGINLSSGYGTLNTTTNINANNFTTLNHTIAAASGAITAIIQVGSGTNGPIIHSISNNTFTNLTSITTGSFTFISNSWTRPANGTGTVNDNSIVTAFNKTGAGGTVQLYNSNSSSPATVTETNSGNNFSNITVTGATILNGWRSTDGGSPAKIVTNNTFNNWTGGTSQLTGLAVSFSGSANISGNTVSNFTSGGIIVGMESTSGTQTWTNNTVTGLTSTGAAAVTGMLITSGGTTNILQKNTVCNLESNNSGGSVNGILVSAGTTTTISNNRIGDLRTPASNLANPLNGINITGGTTVNVYYNTVNISGTSSGALFGSSAISAATGPSLTLNNNIFVNNSTANGAGLTAAYRRSSTTLTSYVATSDRNNFLAPSLFFDGTNNLTTLAAYKVLMVAPRDANSISEIPQFLSTSCGNSNFLKINTSLATGLESGGANVGSITDDFENDIRFGNVGYAGTGTAPDIGADEFNGTPLPTCSGTPVASTITGAAAACFGTGITLSLSQLYNEVGITYQWASSEIPGGPYNNLGTGATQATGNLTVPTYYVVTITCAFGSSFVTAEKTVLINPFPTASASSNSPVCLGSTLNLSSSTNFGTTFAWAGPLTFTDSNQNPSIPNVTLARAGTYTVTVTASGCSTTANTIGTVLNPPIITSTTATPNTICSGENSQLQVNLQAPSAYCTTFAIATTVEAISLVQFAGINNTSTCGTGGSALENFTAISGNVVAGSIYPMTLSGTTDGNFTNYFTAFFDWDQNGTFETAVPIGNITNTACVLTTTNNVTVPAFALNGSTRMRIVKDWVTGAVQPPPHVNYPADPCGTYDFGQAEDYTIIVTGGLNPPTYSWLPATFLDNTTITNPLASAVTTTTTYTVTVTNGAGCTSTGSATVTVNPTVDAGSINGITPLCVGATNTYTSTGTSGGTWSSSDDLVATVDPSTGLVTAIGAGSADITYSINTGCGSPVSQFFTVTVIANTSNTTTISVCDTYTWPVNGTTYTTSGTYTSVTGCHTEILDLTITLSTSNTTTVSVCDTYTWSVNGATYTLSGTYTSVTGCHTEILDLTITPSTSNTTTISACDTYTWAVNGQTYTGSDTYTYVVGCHTEILVLTITPSTSNTTTITQCFSYTWPVNGVTYTTSGTYTDVSGCHTETLVLTIDPGVTFPTDVTACFGYYWDATGQFYDQSGTYTEIVDCEAFVLNLTIANCPFNFGFEFTDPCTCNNDATEAANDGTFSEVAGIVFNTQFVFDANDYVVTVLSSTGTIGLPNGTLLTYNGEIQEWETPPFTHVDEAGYSIVFEVRASVENNIGLDGGELITTVTGSNKCAYPNPAVSGLAGSYCSSDSGGVPDTDITVILTGSPTGPTGTFTLSGTYLTGGPEFFTFTPPATLGSTSVSGIYTGVADGNGGVSPDGGTTPAFPGCIQPFSATTNILDCPPGCNASPIMQWDN